MVVLIKNSDFKYRNCKEEILGIKTELHNMK